ncbi:MAG: flagellar basal body P-ring formation chaperone FlgA [Vicinamibacterales bacterium]
MTTLTLLFALAAAPSGVATLPPAVDAAVTAAVRARVGADAEVVITAVEAFSAPAGEVTDAVVQAGATIGGPVALVLRGLVVQEGATTIAPIGRVVVRLRVTATHLHASRAVPRGAHLTANDLVMARHALPVGPLKALPSAEWLDDARALQDLAADACLTPRVVTASAAVVAGRDVSAVVREGQVEVRAALVAVDSGAVGSEVRVMHPESRRTMRARVTGRAEVEIRHDR